MDLRIGINHTSQVVEIELPDDVDREALKGDLETALSSDEKTMVWVTDKRGRLTGVASDRISFVELGAVDAERRIGFGA